MAIRIVLVGDDGVGKTSLVSCVVNDAFQEKEPVPVLPEVAAPGDLNLTPGRAVTLVDTSNRPASRIAFQLVRASLSSDCLESIRYMLLANVVAFIVCLFLWKPIAGAV